MPEYSISRIDKFDDQHPGQVVEGKDRGRGLIIDYLAIDSRPPGQVEEARSGAGG
jgi:hypothetical protein